MTVTYIAHSAFLVEWDKFYTLFDYVYEEEYTGELPELDPAKPLLVFASHRHEDHFDAKVCRLRDKYPLTQFFFSRDVNLSERRRGWLNISDEDYARITLLRSDEVYMTEVAGEELVIRTIKSTDIGLAFLVRAEGKVIYHAGDCNWWHWTSEGKAYCDHMELMYKKAVEKIGQSVRNEALDSGCAERIDVAMVPLDPRLQGGFDLGVTQLLKVVDVGCVFPMHLWEKYDTVRDFCRKHPPLAPKMMPVTHKGQVFEV